MEKKKRITIVGCGPGAPSYVTPAARNACFGADVAVGYRSVFDLMDDAPDERIYMKTDVAAVLDEVAALSPDKSVAVLATGDPGVFSIAAAFIERFGADECEIIPGVSSVQVAFARLGLSWAGASIVSAHHRKPEDAESAFRNSDRVAILAGAAESSAWIAEALEKAGDGWSAFACEDLTLETEKISAATPGDLEKGGYSSRTIVVAIRKELLK